MTIERAIELMMKSKKRFILYCDEIHKKFGDENIVSKISDEFVEAYEIALKCMETCEIVDDKVYVEVLKDEPKKD